MLFKALNLFAFVVSADARPPPVPSSVVDARPPPIPSSQGAVSTGVYRNMFLEAGYKQADIDAKVEAAFSQLYLVGDPTTQRIAFEVDGNMTYVTDAKNHDVRTEGMSYGMMTAVQMNNQTLFDRLWRWTLTFMYHSDPTDQLYGWSAWHCTITGQRIDQGPALDGETFFVTALYFAGIRFGNSGEYNYTDWANTILGLVTSKPTPQEMFDPVERIVRFDPGTTFSDPSYMTAHFYPTWGINGNVSRSIWNETADKTRDLLSKVTSSHGLAPNMCGFDGSKAGWVNDFEDDAWRVVRNWAVDYSWWAVDSRQIGMSNSLISFFTSCGNPCNCDYFDTNSGACHRQQYSSGLTAMNAVAALASNSTDAWDFVDALWNMPIPSGDDHDTDRYYSGSLYLESLLHLSGRYRAWI